MPFELLTKNVLIKDLDNLPPFIFSDTLANNSASYAITGYSFSYPTGDDHHLSSLTIEVQKAAVQDDRVTLMISVAMTDRSNRSMDRSKSWITITVVAWAGSLEAFQNIGLGNTGLSDTGTQQIKTPVATSASTFAPLLGGFSFFYSLTKDHDVQQVAASVSVGNSGDVTLKGQMTDHSGNSSSVRIDGGMILGYGTKTFPGFDAQMLTLQKPANLVPIIFNTPLSACGAVLFAFKCHYQSNDEHHINSIRMGITGNTPTDGKAKSDYLPYIDASDTRTVMLVSPAATMDDKSANKQENSQSSAGFLVIGIPAGPPTAVTKVAEYITSTSVTLVAVINANGESTQVSFSYGTSPYFGSRIDAQDVSPVYPITCSQLVTVRVVLTGLTPNTKYYFAVTASHSGSTISGSTLTFTTRA